MNSYTTEVQIFKRSENPNMKTVSSCRDYNIDVTKDFITQGGDAQPILFIITDEHMFFVQLDTKMASETKSSPLDQVEMIMKMLVKKDERFKDVLAYQVVGEAWMWKGSKETPPLAYGDISSMAGRIEVLMETIVEKDVPTKYKIFEIIRERDSEKLVEFKENNVEDNDRMESSKFPLLPIGRVDNK